MIALNNEDICQKAKTLTAATLFIIGAGTLTVAALMAPNVIQVLQPLFKGNKWRRQNYERERIRQALKRLTERRVVVLYQRGNSLFIQITEKGKRRLRELEFDNLCLPKEKRWDRKWRVVIFDIPEQYKRARHIFQQKLREVGFYQLQKSVLVYPFECRDEIDFMTSFCEIQPFVHYLETSDLDKKEGSVRKFFGLV